NSVEMGRNHYSLCSEGRCVLAGSEETGGAATTYDWLMVALVRPRKMADGWDSGDIGRNRKGRRSEQRQQFRIRQSQSQKLRSCARPPTISFMQVRRVLYYSGARLDRENHSCIFQNGTRAEQPLSRWNLHGDRWRRGGDLSTAA